VESRARALIGLIALVGVGCSDGPAAPGDAAGTFEATLSGAITQRATGTATLLVDPFSYAIQMSPASGRLGLAVTVWADGVRLPVGTYPITPVTTRQTQPTALALACADTTKECAQDWGAHWETPEGAGRIVITASSPAGVAGNLEVDLRGPNADVSQVVHLVARFNATCKPGLAC